MRRHLVRRGEDLFKIAYAQGFDAEAVWAAAENKALSELRKDPHILCTGDVLYVPDTAAKGLSLNVGGSNVFTATVSLGHIEIKFLDRDQPVSKAPCTIAELPDRTDLKTDGCGVLALDIPVNTDTLTISIPSVPLVQIIKVGHLDPIDTPSGLVHRLRNLGHLGQDDPYDDDVHPEHLAHAVKGFQAANGITMTGVPDAATLSALKNAHGC